MEKHTPWKNRRFTAILGLLTAFFLQYAIALPAGSTLYANSWLAAAVFAVYALAVGRYTAGPQWPVHAKRYLPAALVLGTVFALALVLGAQLQAAGRIDYAAWPRWLAVPVLGMAFAPCLVWLMARLETGGGYSMYRRYRGPLLPEGMAAVDFGVYRDAAGRLAGLLCL